MINILSSTIGIIISEQTSICKLFSLTKNPDSFPFVTYIEALIFFFTFQRSPFTVSVPKVTCELSFIELFALINFDALPLLQVIGIQPLIQFTPILLDSLPISKPILETPHINPLISIVHSRPIRFSFLPLPIIILKSDCFVKLVNPYHFALSRSSIIHEIANIEVPILINLYPKSIPLIEEQLPLINLSLMANNQPLPVPFPIYYCSYIELIIIDGYFRTPKQLEISKGGSVALQGSESHKILGNLLMVCSDQLYQFALPL